MTKSGCLCGLKYKHPNTWLWWNTVVSCVETHWFLIVMILPLCCTCDGWEPFKKLLLNFCWTFCWANWLQPTFCRFYELSFLLEFAFTWIFTVCTQFFQIIPDTTWTHNLPKYLLSTHRRLKIEANSRQTIVAVFQYCCTGYIQSSWNSHYMSTIKQRWSAGCCYYHYEI